MAIEKSKIDSKYRAYLYSTEWRKIAYLKKQQSGFTCKNCWKRFPPKSLNVHHIDYTFLYREKEGMHTLACLCEPCHKKHHQEIDDMIAYNRWYRAQRVDWFGCVGPDDE